MCGIQFCTQRPLNIIADTASRDDLYMYSENLGCTFILYLVPPITLFCVHFHVMMT